MFGPLVVYANLDYANIAIPGVRAQDQNGEHVKFYLLCRFSRNAWCKVYVYEFMYWEFVN